MNLVFLLSVILKGIGALLEILLQILITNKIGVSGYGNYSTWINLADLLFWIFFSGLIKCNTFYLSGKNTSIRTFKLCYYSRYVLPVSAIAAVVVGVFSESFLPCIVIAITLLEVFVLDNSSSLIARGNARISLVGEYVLGRTFLVCSVWLVSLKATLTLPILILLYVLQYCLVLVFFFVCKRNKKKAYTDISDEVSIRKWSEYQFADLMHSMIEQMPVVLQYFFVGGFEAGVVSIVLLVKKLINFISGPTAKIFLPEFSRLYREGEHKKICSSYASIMRIQMLIVGPLAVVLLGYPRVILRILASELVSYDWLFMICSIVFLLVATLGPCGGVLQMTGNERIDNQCRGIAIICMIMVMFFTRTDSYFVLYGLCAQVAIEALEKYIFVCRWMKKAPTGFITYLKWWSIPVGCILVTYLLRLNDSFGAMIIVAGIVFGISLVKELSNKENNLLKKLSKNRS